MNKLWKPKENGAEEIIPFFSTHNPNNPNNLSIITQIFENLEHGKTMSNVFSGKKQFQLWKQKTYLSRPDCKEEYTVEAGYLVKEREDKCLQATHKAATVSTNKSGTTSSPLV